MTRSLSSSSPAPTCSMLSSVNCFNTVVSQLPPLLFPLFLSDYFPPRPNAEVVVGSETERARGGSPPLLCSFSQLHLQTCPLFLLGSRGRRGCCSALHRLADPNAQPLKCVAGVPAPLDGGNGSHNRLLQPAGPGSGRVTQPLHSHCNLVWALVLDIHNLARAVHCEGREEKGGQRGMGEVKVPTTVLAQRASSPAQLHGHTACNTHSSQQREQGACCWLPSHGPSAEG